MKRLLFVLILLSVGLTGIFAQENAPPRFEDGYMSIDGHEWVTFNNNSKLDFIIGMFFGLDLYRFMLADTGYSFGEYAEQRGVTGEGLVFFSEFLDALDSYGNFGVTPSFLVGFLDTHYSDKSRRDEQVWEVLLTESGKKWW